MKLPRANCLTLFRQWIRCAFNLTLLRAVRSRAARMPMMAIVTSNSISVKARVLQESLKNEVRVDARVSIMSRLVPLRIALLSDSGGRCRAVLDHDKIVIIKESGECLSRGDSFPAK